MAGYSSGESYKQHSPSKASVLGELHEAQRTIRRLEEKLQKMEVQQARPSHSDIIHIDLHQGVLQMTLAVRRIIGEGKLHLNSMAIDITTKGRDITVEMDTTKMQGLGYLRSKFLVSMGIVILMCI